MTREEDTGGDRRPVGAERGVDERKAEALAVDMSDLESEPRQAIVALCPILGNARVLTRVFQE